MRARYIPLVGASLTGRTEFGKPLFTEGTMNLHPDGEGYLINYQGRTDMFVRGSDSDFVGVPPSGTITRIESFRDLQGREHLVFVMDGQICETYGNGYTVLYTLTGESYSGGQFYPSICVHEGKLIIANFGDPVLIWDGVALPTPLGVAEDPRQPEMRSTVPPYADSSAPFRPFEYQNVWWPGSMPHSGPSANKGADGATDVFGFYQAVVQFMDQYGNKSRVSSATPVVKINSKLTNDIRPYLQISWLPPFMDSHIVGVIVGRTLNQNEDGGAGVSGVYYQEAVIQNTCETRHTVTIYDGTLAQSPLLDMECRGPMQARGACSWKGRIWLWGGQDPYLVEESDEVYFGQFRDSKRHRARDHVSVVAPMGDRLAVITRSTVEVYYDNAGATGILEQDFHNGSSFGRSFVDVGNGAIFGLWNRGFGFYTGREYRFVETPYWIQSLYQSPLFRVHSAILVNGVYLMTVCLGYLSDSPNRILYYVIDSGQWYILSESVYDMTWWRGSILGSKDSIYELFKGVPDTSIMVMKGLMPEEDQPNTERPLSIVRLHMEPSSNEPFTVVVSGEYPFAEERSTKAASMPSKNISGRFTDLCAYWNDSISSGYGSPWVSPREYNFTPQMTGPVTAVSHMVTVTFTAGHKIRLKGLHLEWGGDQNDRV
jgi:hypothetical protein